VTDGILQKVIGPFNPFCEGDKDPQAEETDQCANYAKPPDDELHPRPSEQPESKSAVEERNVVLPYLIYVVLLVTANLICT